MAQHNEAAQQILVEAGEQAEQLNLSKLDLVSLPNSIGQLTQLKHLQLQNNQLTELPDFIGQLIQLQRLELSGNQLTKLPDSIGQLTQLQYLGLNGNQLTELPNSIGELTQLQGLYLNDNQLTKLPDSIEQLTQLQRLVLNGNQLTELPNSIGEFTQLQGLYLNDNQLTKLPDSIEQLTQLQDLILAGNQLIKLPDSIGELTQLQRLVLNDNQLIELPEMIMELPLATLDLRRNKGLGIPAVIAGSSQSPSSPVMVLQYYFSHHEPNRTSNISRDTILRQIEFTPEYRQAGLGILNYFREVLEQRYPEVSCTIRIEQEGQKVRMIIQTPEGQRDVVEQTLEEYGLVITGQRQPVELFDDAVYVMRLENKLTMVEAELQLERRAYVLLEGQKQMAEQYTGRQDARIRHLETEFSELRQIVGNSLAGVQQTSHLLAAGAVDHNQALATLFGRYLERSPDNDTLRQAISTFQKFAERTLASTDQAVLSGDDKIDLTRAANEIQTEDDTYWAAFKAELIVFFSNVAAGVGGNVVTEILQLIKVL